MKNIALFGFGRAGKLYTNFLQKSSKFNLKYIVDPALADVAPAGFLSNDQNAVWKDESVSAIVITTSTHLHYDLIETGLRNNKHIYVEKPISLDYSEIKQSFEMARQKNLTLLTGMNRRFDPDLNSVKKIIDQGKIGKITQATSVSGQFPYPGVEYLKLSPSLFHDCAVHDIDYLNWIFNDRPISVHVIKAEKKQDSTDSSSKKRTNKTLATVVLEYENNRVVTLDFLQGGKFSVKRCEFIGEDGDVSIKQFDNQKQKEIPEKYSKSYENILDHFYDCIAQKDKPKVSEEDNLNTLIIADACEQSVYENQKVKIKYPY